MIKWIVFDFDEVISPTTFWYSQLVEDLAKSFPLNKQEAEPFLKEEGGKWFTNEWNEHQFLREFNKKFRVSIPFEVLDKELEKGIQPNEEVIEVIKQLKKKYKIGLLTDNPKFKIEKIMNHPLMKKTIDHPAGSGIYNIRKKSGTEIFEKLQKDLRVKTSEILFIDDNPRNCKFAEEAGLQVISFVLGNNNKERLLNQLKHAGIQL